jgi:peptidoglycan-associated lipoprotein
LASGCKPTYPKCGNDDDCKEHNEVCVQGQCQECATDGNCKPGFVCDTNRCVPKGECTNDSGCGPGAKCRSGKCIAGACDGDKDCGSGSKCMKGKCVYGACSTNADCASGESCKNGMCAADASACNWEPVTFEFNEFKLGSDAQSRLSTLAECLKKEKGPVRLEGHADERGTEEYNLQLSNKRAASVKRYLVDLGVPNATLETVGFGENRPAQSGSSESAWAANRRVEFNKK